MTPSPHLTTRGKKGFTLKKESPPLERKLFMFRVDPFSERSWYVEGKQKVTKVASLEKRKKKSIMCIKSQNKTYIINIKKMISYFSDWCSPVKNLALIATSILPWSEAVWVLHTEFLQHSNKTAQKLQRKRYDSDWYPIIIKYKLDNQISGNTLSQVFPMTLKKTLVM